MPMLTITVAHRLPLAEARRRLNDCLAGFEQRYGRLGKLQACWCDGKLRLKLTMDNTVIVGQLRLDQSSVCLDLLPPWGLQGISQRLRTLIEEAGQRWLAE